MRIDFFSNIDFMTSVFMLPLKVKTATAAWELTSAEPQGVLLLLEVLRCELLPSSH